MRIVNTFKYKNKIFRAGELTLGDYMISTEDFEYFIEKILSEYNPKPPKLSPEELRAFLDILFGVKDNMEVFKSKKSEKQQKDFHIVLAIFMKNMGQGYADVCDMPLRLFNKMVDDMECILDPSKYDPNRNDTTPDKKGLKEVFGDKKIITG